MRTLRSRARRAAAAALWTLLGAAGAASAVSAAASAAPPDSAAPAAAGANSAVPDATGANSAAPDAAGPGVALAGVAGAGTAAIDAQGQIKDPALEARFESITKQLRCLVCQNESIADSNVELADQLRRQVREMLIAGQSDAAIFAFMTDRYGEFVRFNTPLEPKTLLIWGAPFVLLLIGAGAVYRIVRVRARMPLDDEPASGTP